jgi:hypothetical protein
MRNACLAILAIAVVNGCAQDAAPKPQTGLVVTLQWVEENGPCVRLIGENRSEVRITVVRPTRYWFDCGGAFGWSLKVKGPAGIYLPLVPPGGPPMMTGKNLIELWPGDGFSVRVSLADWHVQHGQKFGGLGDYTVEAEYTSPAAFGEFKEGEIKQLPIPRHEPVKSETLKLHKK